MQLKMNTIMVHYADQSAIYTCTISIQLIRLTNSTIKMT